MKLFQFLFLAVVVLVASSQTGCNTAPKNVGEEKSSMLKGTQTVLYTDPVTVTSAAKEVADELKLTVEKNVSRSTLDLRNQSQDAWSYPERIRLSQQRDVQNNCGQQKRGDGAFDGEPAAERLKQSSDRVRHPDRADASQKLYGD